MPLLLRGKKVNQFSNLTSNSHAGCRTNCLNQPAHLMKYNEKSVNHRQKL